MTMQGGTLEDVDLEQLWQEDAEDKMCSFKSHNPGVKAVAQCLCLACGKFCGYVCGKHESELIAVMDRNQKGHWIACAHCHAKNLVTFLPL